MPASPTSRSAYSAAPAARRAALWARAAPGLVADLDGLAGQVAAAFEALGLSSYHVLGTSFGGACALHLTLRFPERVISLILESPARLRAESVNPAELPPERFVAAFRTHPERGLPLEAPGPAYMARVWPTVMRLLGGWSTSRIGDPSTRLPL